MRRSAGDVSVPASGHSLNEVMPAGMVSAISEAIRNRSPQKAPRAGFARHRALAIKSEGLAQQVVQQGGVDLTV